jgi:hypothetical protein
MKLSFSTVLFFCFAIGALNFHACKNGWGDNKQHSTPALDSLLADTALMGDQAILPKNESLPQNGPIASEKPAKIFLKELTYLGLAKNIELADSLMILEGKDSFLFPLYLPRGKWTNFIAIKEGYIYSLDVSRINFTTLDFNFELRRGNKTISQFKGKADLRPGFVLGSESDDDPAEGHSYFSNAYDFQDESCFVSIRLGDDEGVKKVKVEKNCKNDKYNIDLENCPVLLEK